MMYSEDETIFNNDIELKTPNETPHHKSELENIVIDQSGYSPGDHLESFMSEDIEREEMRWDTNMETMLSTWADEMEALSRRHGHWARLHHVMFYSMSISTLVMSIIITSRVESEQNDSFFWIKMPTTINVLAAGLQALFNFGGKAQGHTNSMNDYSSGCRNIRTELQRPKRFRTAADVFIERMRMNYIHWNIQSL